MESKEADDSTAHVPEGIDGDGEKEESPDAGDASPSVGLFKRLFTSGRKSRTESQGSEALFDNFAAVPEEQVCLLTQAADEAERRLIAKVDDEGTWTEFGGSLVGLAAGLRVWHRPSDVRAGGGLSAKTSFVVEKLPGDVAEVVQQLIDAGSLDFGFKTKWSRSIGHEGTTTVRHLTLSKWMTNRDFFCVTRSGFVRPPPPEDLPGMYKITHETSATSGVFLGSKHVADIQPGSVVVVKEVVTDDVALRVRARIMEPAGWISLMNTESSERWVEKVARTKSFLGALPDGEQSGPDERRRYVFASTSLNSELMASAGIPEVTGGTQRGEVYVSGVLAAGTGDGSCRVEVMIDLDAAVTQLPTGVVDRDVRLQMLSGAVKLHRALTGAPESDGYPPVEEVAAAPPKMRLSETWTNPGLTEEREPDRAA